MSVIGGLIFKYFPRIDIWFSSIFYKDGEFYLSDYPWIDYFYQSAHVGALLLALIVIVTYVVVVETKLHKPGNEKAMRIKKACLFLLIAMLIGPVITVNGVMKEGIGRARPTNVAEFGGDKIFTPAFTLADQCSSNCSFVSGHASAGFFLVTLALVARREWRRKVFWITLTYGGLIGMTRVAQGKHFLSDVIFAFVITYGVSKLVHYAMYREKDAFP
ncbi:phosphatase PAP2 family protein [Limisalsivibrio acetivorans]|uniref:phosphatase PAP2 family protein n=1 Tax=Limisalsivibrio acetivorans TaxID=1304888 RepID=UPI00138AB8F6|nr:phosphatase PAP2 family protein [Limisalsivibrio acetivorans]